MGPVRILARILGAPGGTSASPVAPIAQETGVGRRCAPFDCSNPRESAKPHARQVGEVESAP